jgi:hypothetical protein
MPLGKILIWLGLALLAAGLALTYMPGLLFGWFGKLPGDLRLGDGNRSVYIPIASMTVVSLLLTLLINLFFRR